MIFRDDKTRMSWEYFLRSKDEPPDMLEQWLTGIRLHGIPEIIRSHDASELNGGKFNEICRKQRIKQEFTLADKPQLNGVADRGLTLIDKLTKACAFQARVSFKVVPFPTTVPLWPEAHNHACDVFNRTATSSNPGCKSPYEMWYGEKPPPTMLEWLQLCFYRAKRDRKIDAQAKPGYIFSWPRN